MLTIPNEKVKIKNRSSVSYGCSSVTPGFQFHHNKIITDVLQSKLMYCRNVSLGVLSMSLWFCCFTAKVKEKECCALSFRNISDLPGVFVICYDKYSKLKLDLELSYKNCLVLQEKME